MKIESIQCKDGSKTLFLPDLDETYHSRHGAITESQYVYIDHGLAQVSPNTGPIRILEFGLGTGLNALLSLKYANEHGLQLEYMSVEKFPLMPEHLAELNYSMLLDAEDEFAELHQLPWGEWASWQGQHRLYKFQGDFLTCPIEAHSVDLIYYDAFAPSKQAEVWELPYLEFAVKALKVKGILVTYCAQGQFKRNLKSLGMSVNKFPGPPGKAEMVQAVLL